MTNLAGQDMEAVLEAFHAVQDDAPRCFIAYTIKGFGTPLAGHKDNHAGLMTPDQMARFKSEDGIADGREWELFAKAGVPESTLRNYVQGVAFNAPGSRIHAAARVVEPERLKLRTSLPLSPPTTPGGVCPALHRQRV